MNAWLGIHQAHVFVAVVLLAAMAAVTVTFDIFQPKTMPDEIARKIVFLINVPVGFNVAYALWTSVQITALDNAAKLIVCIIASVLAAAGAPYYHRVIFALLRWKFPDFRIESAFSTGNS